MNPCLCVITAPEGDRSQLSPRLLGEDHEVYLAAVFAALVLAGLVLAAGLSAHTGVSGVLALVGLSLLWLVVNGPMEGPVLIPFSRNHGLTGADLAGVVGLAIAARRLRVRRRPANAEGSPASAGTVAEQPRT